MLIAGLCSGWAAFVPSPLPVPLPAFFGRGCGGFLAGFFVFGFFVRLFIRRMTTCFVISGVVKQFSLACGFGLLMTVYDWQNMKIV